MVDSWENPVEDPLIDFCSWTEVLAISLHLMDIFHWSARLLLCLLSVNFLSIRSNLIKAVQISI